MKAGDEVVVCVNEFGPQYFEEFGHLDGEYAEVLGEDGAYWFVRFHKPQLNTEVDEEYGRGLSIPLGLLALV